MIVTVAASRKSTSAIRPEASDTRAQPQALAQVTRTARPLNCAPPLPSTSVNWPAASSSIKVIGPSGIAIPAIDSSWQAIIVSASGNGTCQWPIARKIG